MYKHTKHTVPVIKTILSINSSYREYDEVKYKNQDFPIFREYDEVKHVYSEDTNMYI